MIKLLKKKQLLGVITSTLVSVFLAAGFVFAAVTVSTNLQVGSSSTPDITLNGEDAYIGGTLEVEGVAYFGGDIHASSTIVNLGDAITDTVTVAGIFNANSTTTFTPNGAYGDVTIATGNLVIGNGTPDTTPAGEALYVEGTFEVDGTARFDGNVLLGNATTDTLTVNATTTFTPSAAGGGVIVQTGNFRVGTGTAPSVNLDGEDMYVEGTLEVDGAVRFDGGVTLGSAITDTITSSGIFNANSTTTFTPNGTYGDVTIATGNLVIGNGTPDTTPDGEDLYVEGNVEIDGTLTIGAAATTTIVMTSSGTAGTCFVLDFIDGTVRYMRATTNGVLVNTTDCQ